MPRFEINEIAIYCPEIGTGGECVILEEPRPRYLLGRMWHDLYLIEYSGQTQTTTCELYLRKRNPPMGDWESLESNIGWERPVEVVIEGE